MFKHCSLVRLLLLTLALGACSKDEAAKAVQPAAVSASDLAIARSQVLDSIATSHAIRLALAEEYANIGKMPQAGLFNASEGGLYAEPITHDEAGVVTITLRASEPTNASVRGYQLTFTPRIEDGYISAWICAPVGEGSAEFLPAECQAADSNPQAATAPQSARFVQAGDGVLQDSQTGLYWTQRDNLADIDWNDAKAYCSSLALDGGGWQLPTMADLSMLHAGAQGNKVPCLTWQCTAPKAFYLTGPGFWSGDQGESSAVAWDFALRHGPASFSVYLADDLRALCVRRRS